MKECFICHRITNTECHHIFGGPFRNKSTKYGLTVNLCHFCHNETPNGVHFNRENMLELKRYGQQKVMQEQGWSTKDFIREFGKNYL